MAQLDRLLAVLVSRRGDSIRLVQDEPAVLVRGSETQPLTRTPLTPAQVLAIVREVAPADIEQHAERADGAQFDYKMGEDAFVGRIHRVQGRLTVDVSPRSAPASNGHATGNGNGNGRTNTPRLVTAVNPRTDDEARAVIDELLRQQASRKASDLHLRSDERPMYRVDGASAS